MCLFDSYVYPNIIDIQVREDLSLSDHSLILFGLKTITTTINETFREIKYRSYSDENKVDFHKYLDEFFPHFNELDTPGASDDAFQDILITGADSIFPEKITTKKQSKKKVWFKEEHSLARKEANKKDRQLDNYVRYKGYVNRKSYYTHKFDVVKNNPRKNYKNINEILADNRLG